jgi:hypothetical protein
VTASSSNKPCDERVGQTLHFFLSDLVRMKDEPARTCTASLLKSQFESYSMRWSGFIGAASPHRGDGNFSAGSC